MSHLSFLFTILISFSAFSQKRWDGGGGNTQWSNALNWSGNTVPGAADDVVLDNSIVTVTYSVVLPNTAVTVRTITITPNTSRTIDLTLPNTNTLVPGLTVSGPGYGMVINTVGIFKNSSGSASGNAVVVLDSIKINNDGKYVHNSSGGHASNVLVLSRAPGTERGVFEFDIPTASSTISVSGRTFGRLNLRSTAAGGTCNYTAVGTSRVTLKNSLDIGAGANLNLNFSDTISIAGDLIQEAGTLNLGNSTRSVVMLVQQNITQNTGGTITETGTGIQTLLMSSAGLQVIIMKGTVLNSIILKKDGAGNALFKWPLSLPYKLELSNGKIGTTQGLITLQSACTIQADTLLLTSFIEGPLKKDGLANQGFLFPVGKSNTLRWLQLQNATGNFTIEFFKTDPHSVSATEGVGIDHISSVEYWDVTTTAGSTAKVKLSFDDPHSGGVTNLSSLRVARLINGTWEDAGNSGVAGTPGSDGWVSSNAASGFSANSKLFALASAMGLENPLPLSSIELNKIESATNALFYWTGLPDLSIDTYELQKSWDGINFATLHFFQVRELSTRYSYKVINADNQHSKLYYRVVARSSSGVEYISNQQIIASNAHMLFSIVGSNITTQKLKIILPDWVHSMGIYDAKGNLNKLIKCTAQSNTVVEVDASFLNPGVYLIRPISIGNTATARAIRFVKL